MTLVKVSFNIHNGYCYPPNSIYALYNTQTNLVYNIYINLPQNSRNLILKTKNAIDKTILVWKLWEAWIILYFPLPLMPLGGSDVHIQENEVFPFNNLACLSITKG